MLERINTSIIGSMRLFRNQLFAIACLLLLMYPQISNASDWRCEAANRSALSVATINAFYNDPVSIYDVYYSPVGTVLRYYLVDAEDEGIENMPAGFLLYRVLYVTTSRIVYGGSYEMRVVASGLISLPLDPNSTTNIKIGKQTLLYTHGTVGISPECGPSRELEDVYIPDWMYDANLKTAAPDYYGLGYDYDGWFWNPDRGYTFSSDVDGDVVDGVPFECSAGMQPFANSKHHYIGAQSEARSSIDIVRAAQNLEQIIVHPCDTISNVNGQFAVVGASQGGHAALAVGELMDDGYANDLELRAIVAGAPPSVLRIDSGNKNLPMILVGFAQEFIGITPSEFMTDEGMCNYLHHVDTKCGGINGDYYYGMPSSNPFNRSYAQLANDLDGNDDFLDAVESNTPGLRSIAYDIMIGQNTNDPRVPHLETDALVDDLESQGANVTYCKSSDNYYWWGDPVGEHNNHDLILWMMFNRNMMDQDNPTQPCDSAKEFLDDYLDMVDND